jgi:hypothetical protein
MPISFEDYLKHYNDAKTAWIKLYTAIGQLRAAVEQVVRSPGILANPAGGAWPTQSELMNLLREAQQKSAPLLGEHSQLPQDVKGYAPAPQSASERPAGH